MKKFCGLNSCPVMSYGFDEYELHAKFTAGNNQGKKISNSSEMFDFLHISL